MDHEAQSDGGIEILGKAAAVVDALTATAMLSATALARAVGEPVSSTYRLLQSLIALAWVEAAPLRGMYRLGPAFLQTGGALEDSLDVRAVALPHMRRLRSSLGVAVLLCYRRGIRAVCVERIDGHDVRSVAMRIGDSLPLHVGGAPTALLAWLPAGEQHALIDEMMADAADTPAPVPTAAGLDDLISGVRARGYGRSDEDVTLGIAAFGAPIFNHRGELTAAVSISGLRESLLGQERAMTTALTDAAAAISADLGFGGDADA